MRCIVRKIITNQRNLILVKRYFFAASLLMLLIIGSACSTGRYIRADQVMELDVQFAGPRWNSITIPPGEGCRRCGENGSTPALIVKNIPSNANLIIMEYCDRSYQLMNNGG